MNTRAVQHWQTNATIKRSDPYIHVNFNVTLNLNQDHQTEATTYTQRVELRQRTERQPGQGLYNKAELDRNGDGIMI